MNHDYLKPCDCRIANDELTGEGYLYYGRISDSELFFMFSDRDIFQKDFSVRIFDELFSDNDFIPEIESVIQKYEPTWINEHLVSALGGEECDRFIRCVFDEILNGIQRNDDIIYDYFDMAELKEKYAAWLAKYHKGGDTV